MAITGWILRGYVYGEYKAKNKKKKEKRKEKEEERLE
jgi:hypothetical protein